MSSAGLKAWSGKDSSRAKTGAHERMKSEVSAAKTATDKAQRTNTPDTHKAAEEAHTNAAAAAHLANTLGVRGAKELAQAHTEKARAHWVARAGLERNAKEKTGGGGWDETRHPRDSAGMFT